VLSYTTTRNLNKNNETPNKQKYDNCLGRRSNRFRKLMDWDLWMFFVSCSYGQASLLLRQTNITVIIIGDLQKKTEEWQNDRRFINNLLMQSHDCSLAVSASS